MKNRILLSVLCVLLIGGCPAADPACIRRPSSAFRTAGENDSAERADE